MRTHPTRKNHPPPQRLDPAPAFPGDRYAYQCYRLVVRKPRVDDHLKAAAQASAMTNSQLIAVRNRIVDIDNLTSQQQAVIDEIKRRAINT